ncbi:SMEK domain-containing protein [Planctomycetes bacterium K23_9]|uniref:SMEK domain-containing protein n=1 Tax=Stieleria marina TaxID=1930275 RepID=A0A517NUB6_9BACT|nr:hypothetical protein K239x_26750 [Planctomycetes bacterium K23_9]
MKSLELLAEIVEAIEILGRKIETLNSLNLTDLSVRSEEFFREILNRVLDLDLKNINIEQPSAAAIDLGDVEAKLAIQVTANGTAKKVRDTVSKFVERGLASQYDRLVILQIAKEGGRNIDDICDPHDLKFDPKSDIWGKKELARQISALPTEALQSLHDYMKLELPSLFGAVTSTDASPELRVDASYAGGKNGTSASLTIFNSGSHTRYLSSWFVEWSDKSAVFSIKCESGSLPYRLQEQDRYTIVINLDRPRLEGISEVGILDGDNNSFKAPPGQIAILKQEAERRATLYPQPDSDNAPDFSECEMEVAARVEFGDDGKQLLVFTVTNMSDIAVPIVGANLEWQYDPPRSRRAENDATTKIREVQELGGSVNLDCRSDLTSPVAPGGVIQFYLHDSMERLLLETLLGDVPDQNVSFVFGAKSGTGWKATEEGIPEAVREHAEYIRDGGQISGRIKRQPQEWIVDTFAQEITSADLADGTNVIEGTDYAYSGTRTTTWYVPRESETMRNWESRWKKMREHFDRMAFVTRPIECTMLQQRIPGYHLNPLPELMKFSADFIGTGSGLSREPAQLVTPDGIPIFSEFPIRDAVGTPITNSVGEGFGWRFGVSRQYFKKGGPNWAGEDRKYPGPSVEELASECASLLYGLPPELAASVWRNWPQGFDRRSNSSEYFWYDAVFELAWQGQPGDRLYADRYAPVENGSIELVGDGLLPRVPNLEFLSVRVAHEYGHPVQITSKLTNIVLASIAAIDRLLDRGAAMVEKYEKEKEA